MKEPAQVQNARKSLKGKKRYIVLTGATGYVVRRLAFRALALVRSQISKLEFCGRGKP